MGGRHVGLALSGCLLRPFALETLSMSLHPNLHYSLTAVLCGLSARDGIT